MKKLFLFSILFLLLGSGLSFAQQDTKAKNILEAVSKKINGLKSLKANFALHLVSANGKTSQTKKGSFFMKGPKYKLTLGDQEIICDSKNVWTYIKAANEVQISTYSPDEQTISPDKLFTNFYDKEYRYKYAGSRKLNGKEVDLIELTPLNNSKQFSKVDLAVDKSNTIVGGNVYEKNGNHYRYEISGFTPNAAIADALFTFDAKKYPGVEVVDLR